MSHMIIVHDVLGTLFGLEAPIEEVHSIFADQLEARSRGDVKLARMYAELVVMDWYHAAQRDFTTLSINGQYQPIAAVFKATLPRIFLQAGLVPPQEYATGTGAQDALHKAGAGLAGQSRHFTAKDSGHCGPFGAEVVERVMGSLGKLKPRPGMQDAFTKIYRKQGGKWPSGVEQVDVWGATNGGNALATKIFKGALGDDLQLASGADASSQLAKQAKSSSGVEDIGLFSCDEVRIAKPQPELYAHVKQRVTAGTKSDASLWFVASHTWDLFAAKVAGFKTAWVTYEEFDMVKDIYGTPDVVGSDLADVAEKIMAAQAEP